MTKCYQNPIRFSSVQCRKVEAKFRGGAITGNGGYSIACGGGPAVGSDVLGIAAVISSEQMSGYWQCVQEVDEHFFDLTKFSNSSLMTFPNLYSPESDKSSRKHGAKTSENPMKTSS